MSDDRNFWWFCNNNGGLVLAASCLIALVICVLTIASCDTRNTSLYTQNGYEQVQKQGTADTMWVKRGDKR